VAGLYGNKNLAPQSDEDKATKREIQMESLRYDLAHATPLKDLVLYELNAGVSPEWIFVKYGHMGASLERIKAFKAAIDQQKEAKRERETARTGSDRAA
jgi:hypothetical protein